MIAQTGDALRNFWGWFKGSRAVDGFGRPNVLYQMGSVTRKKASKAALGLEDQGFVFIRDSGDTWAEEITITASLFGEDALEALDTPEEIIQTNKPR